MISVCMATYNGERYIKQQLESILSQLSLNDEIIISDDSSSDNTIKIIEDFNDSRIKIFKDQKFSNPIYNLENAIKNVTGDYIFLSDQDDLWLPNKVVKFMDYFNKYDCLVSDAFVVDANGNIIYESFFKLNKTKKGALFNFVKNGYLGCCMAFNSRMLKYILPFPKNIPMHDIWIGLICELFGKVAFCKDPLLYYRRHGLNYSMASEKSKNLFSFKIFYRFKLLFSLVKRVFTSF